MRQHLAQLLVKIVTNGSVPACSQLEQSSQGVEGRNYRKFKKKKVSDDKITNIRCFRQDSC